MDHPVSDIVKSNIKNSAPKNPLPNDKTSLRKPPVSRPMLRAKIRVADFCILLATAIVTYWWTLFSLDGEIYVNDVIVSGLICIGCIIAFDMSGAYSITKMNSTIQQFSRILSMLTLIFSLSAIAAFLTKTGAEFSRLYFISWYITSLFTLCVWRFYLSSIISRLMEERRLDRRIIILGAGQSAQEIIDLIENSNRPGVHICGIFDDRTRRETQQDIAGYPIIGKFDQLQNFIRDYGVDLVLVSLPLTANNRILEILKEIWIMPIDIRISGHNFPLRFARATYSYVGVVPCLDMFTRPLSDKQVLLKSLFDRLVAGTAILLLSPIMIATAIAVRLESKGPILFKQPRYGFDNQLINIYKFRSMYTDLSDVKADKLVTKDDPRVTKVGRFIRRSSIDELPQLFNVLQGSMSIVGPRPHATGAKAADSLYQDVVDGYYARHKVRPGLTGWAQIHGWRGETDTVDKIAKRIEYDMYYIENYSIFLDAYVVLMTPIVLLTGKNAY